MGALDPDTVIVIFGVVGISCTIFFGGLDLMFRISEQKRKASITIYVKDDRFPTENK